MFIFGHRVLLLFFFIGSSDDQAQPFRINNQNSLFRVLFLGLISTLIFMWIKRGNVIKCIIVVKTKSEEIIVSLLFCFFVICFRHHFSCYVVDECTSRRLVCHLVSGPTESSTEIKKAFKNDFSSKREACSRDIVKGVVPVAVFLTQQSICLLVKNVPGFSLP